MLRAASGQLGTATSGALPAFTRIRPRLNAIASSKGSFEANCPPTGKVFVDELVEIVSDEPGCDTLLIVTMRVERSQRSEMCVPNRASDPVAVAT